MSPEIYKPEFNEEEIDRLIAEMSKYIKLKMMANTHKGHPGFIPSGMCFKRLLDETAELFEATAGNLGREESMKEAADVACFAFYCAMNADG